MNLTDEQVELLETVAGAYEDGHRSQFIFVRTHDGSSVLFQDNHCVSITTGIMDFRRLEAEGLIDFDMSPKDPIGKITGKGLAAYRNAGSVDEKKPENEMEEPDPRSVFVVHGRDEEIRKSMFAFLRAIGLNPMEWSQAVRATGEASPYVGTVLDVAFSQAKAIVVLLTPDEKVQLRKGLHSAGEAENEPQSHQARPNVLFEAGMAMGRCPKRTVLVEVGKLRPFSDIGGRHVVRLDGTPEQRKELAQRLETAGCQVDTSGNDWLSAGHFEVAVTNQPARQTAVQERTEIDRNDALNILEGWFKRRPAENSLQNIAFEETDKELNLPSGTAMKYLCEAGEMCGYEVKRKGPETILFERPNPGYYGSSRHRRF